jgi:D-alanyl-lipoteichoic acid acyltransferase DltB (MBOAT superfamily)
MIDPVSFLLLILLSVGLSHAAFPYGFGNRLFWTVVPGVSLLFITHPLALAFAVVSVAVGIAVFLIARTAGDARTNARAPYAILLLLLVPDIMSLLRDSPVLWLGSAFFVVRQMITVANALKLGATFQEFCQALLLSTFFFAALPSGPVFSGMNARAALKAGSSPAYGEGLYRIFEGFVYLFAVSGFISTAIKHLDSISPDRVDHFAASLALSLLAKPTAAFGILFATFYGYSRMAEGSALLFGFEVPQNFNKPHLARDLADFWKRWHRSMADFVMQYIYLPLLVSTSRAKLAIIAAFLFMGIWHNLSMGFLVWGLGHGIGLAYLLPWARRRNLSPGALRVGSLAYVIALSSIAHGVWAR